VTIRYSITYEFDTREPMTHKGTSTAGSVATAMARAMREAQKALKPVAWSSLVCVVLERVK
jgi:hypothetical protein